MYLSRLFIKNLQDIHLIIQIYDHLVFDELVYSDYSAVPDLCQYIKFFFLKELDELLGIGLNSFHNLIQPLLRLYRISSFSELSEPGFMYSSTISSAAPSPWFGK